jgi:DNA-binding NarL/FixJ family response regulator
MSTTAIKDKRLKNRVFIVDDHPIVRQGLTQLINEEDDLTVCGDAGDITHALQAVAECQPDIVIVDLTLQDGSGIRLVEDLLFSRPGLLILVLSMHDESIYAERCLKAGAKGYIMKQDPPEKVLFAIKKVLNGQIYVSKDLEEIFLNRFISSEFKSYTSPVERLSNRELEVFHLIGQGLKTLEIADKLNLSVKTIETYIEHIKKKMNFRDFRELFMHAVRKFEDIK